VVPVLRVRDLRKSYGPVRAVDGVSFTVESGTVIALLGPNGAGKTTTVEILEGLRLPDSGEIELFGRKVKRIGPKEKARLGVLLQEGAFEPYLRVREVLNLFTAFFPRSLDPDEVLALVGLTEKSRALVRTLSGGQKQRLALAVALLNDPELLFLDEPTAGLDPQARRHVWDIIQDLRARTKTVFLTTHYMEEAETLADWVCIMDHGKIIADGTARELVSRFGPATFVEFPLPPNFSPLFARASPERFGRMEKGRTSRWTILARVWPAFSPGPRSKGSPFPRLPCASRTSRTCSSLSPEGGSAIDRPLRFGQKLPPLFFAGVG
jgi:ABC-2 type transport system ATP-binding protein